MIKLETKIIALIITVLLLLISNLAFVKGEQYYSFTGGGHAHGVGMSMAGAYRLAKAQRDYPAILKYYYRGVSVGARGGLPKNIRAAVYSTRGSLSFSANHHMRVYSRSGTYRKLINKGDVLSVKYSGHRYYLYQIRNGKAVWSKSYSTSFQILPGSATYIRLRNNGRRYKGKFYARSVGSSSIVAINKLPMTTYLKGLGEEPESWPIKGLRTLAVASRTYAVQKVFKKKGNYDISQNQQYYVGIRNAPRMAYAVNSTKNVIITYGGKPIIAAYSANSGGYVADFRTIWGGAGYPYLTARKDDWSKHTKSYRWGPVTFSSSRIQSILRSHRVNIGMLRDIHFSKRGYDRRPTKVRVVGSKGSRTLWAFSQFSSWLGLKSSMMWLRKTNVNKVSINGSVKRLKARRPMLIYGRFSSPKRGTLVLRYKRGRSRWRTAKKVRVNGSLYRIKVRPNTRNRYIFSVRLGSLTSRNMVIYSK